MKIMYKPVPNRGLKGFKESRRRFLLKEELDYTHYHMGYLDYVVYSEEVKRIRTLMIKEGMITEETGFI